ncbi:MAG: hypothetical protein HFJ12_06420 [Bacilli bacterium]|nr:hypothetical protein [Bacilli bacterium]
MNEKKKEKEIISNQENKKIMILVVAILVVILVCYLIMTFIGNGGNRSSDNIENMMKQSETKVLYIWNSDSKKCKDCKKIRNHLRKKKINYIDYDVKNYTNSKYEKMLTTLSINPPDFNYPAVIYIKDGYMYSNIININDTKTVDVFIKEYQLQDVK